MSAFKPNIENLKKYVAENGNEIKNFKVLCSVLGISDRGRHEAVYKKLGTFVQYNKTGHKITIEEFYNKPLYSNERTGKYKNNFTTAFKYLFLKEKEENKLFQGSIEKTLHDWEDTFALYYGTSNKSKSYFNNKLSTIKKLEKEFLNMETEEESDKEYDLLQKVLDVASQIAYDMVNNSFKSLSKDGFISCEKGYCLYDEGYNKYFLYRNSYEYKVIEECEKKALDEINKEQMAKYISKNRGKEDSFVPVSLHTAKTKYKDQYFNYLVYFVNNHDSFKDDKEPISRIARAYKISFSPDIEIEDVSIEKYNAAKDSINQIFVKKVFDYFKKLELTPKDIIPYEEGRSMKLSKREKEAIDKNNLSRFYKKTGIEKLTKEETKNLKYFYSNAMISNDCVTFYDATDLAIIQLVLASCLCRSNGNMIEELKTRKQMQKDMKNGKFCLDKPLKKVSLKNQ